MPRKNPLSKPLHMLKDTALGAISDPKGTRDKVVEQARGAAAIGKMVAESVAGEVASRARARSGTDAPRAESARLHPTPAAPAATPPTKKQGDPVAPSAEPAPAPASAAPAKKAAKKPTPADVAKKTPAKPAKKTTKKTAKKTPAKKAASGPPGDKLPPPKQAPAKKTTKKAPPHEPNPEANG